MKSFAVLKKHLFAFPLMFSFSAFPHQRITQAVQTGVGAVQCSYILVIGKNPAAQKDIRMWVQKFVDEVNEEMSSKRSPKERSHLVRSCNGLRLSYTVD